MNGKKALSEMPAGWTRGNFMETAAIQCGASVTDAFNAFFPGMTRSSSPGV
jgi:hypothetical protein